MYSFDYHRPKTVEEAVSLLQQKSESKLLAGGQSLLPTLKQRLAQPTDLIDLALIPELQGIREQDQRLVIGSMSQHAVVASSELVKQKIPALAKLAAEIGDPQVRNRGTLGGSICHNDPVADYPAAVLGLGAVIQTNERKIQADDFFVDLFETALKEQEVVVAIHFPIPQAACYHMFPNPASRYAMTGVFVARFEQDVRVAVTGVKGCVFRHTAMEEALRKHFSPQSLDDVTINAQDFTHDIHASRTYRAHLTRVMAQRAVQEMV